MLLTRRVILGMAPLVLAAAEKKGKGGRVEMLELTIRRSADEPVISIEGRVRNAGGKTLEGLTLIFSLRAPGGEEVTRQRGNIDSTVLEPGEESEFHWQMNNHARAVEVMVRAVDHTTFDVSLDKPGPYTIE